MDEETLKTMPEYFQKLPKVVRDFIADGVWEERTEEIARKYSLNETQTDSLINNVLFILIGLTKPNDFLETIITELNISRLLTEQIMEDLEMRVFEYVVRSIENKEKRTVTENSKQKSAPNLVPEPTPTKPTPIIENDIPEIRPEITPMVEPEEKVHDIEPPMATNRVWPRRINLIEPEEKPAPKKTVPDFIPKPIEPIATTNPASVPRYTEVVESKTEAKPTEPQKSPEPVTPIVKNYAVDPYREPLE